MKKILAVETSCDDTAVAIVREDGFVVFNQVSNQDEIHQAYGGVVPELASRNHAYYLLPLIEQALKESNHTWMDIDELAVTNRPGLVGSLIVGLVTVKSLSLLLKKPYIAVNHIEGHILSPFLWDQDTPSVSLPFPFLSLIVSGGHTYLFEVKDFGQYYLISRTLDDAAGEVLDKIARSLGLGYPGGAQMDKISQSVSPGRYSFPKIKLKEKSLNFSFSGLKTSAIHLIQKMKPLENKELIPYICADFQSAVINQIIDRLDRAIQQSGLKSIAIAGGVSANSRLRKQALSWASRSNINLILPPLKYCTDNAAMIGFTGLKQLQKGIKSTQELNCYPHSLKEDFYLDPI
ncbi:MAG: tRNA (adenosine(37)-N6)-threonylcarbamoyltransferase complex transferase subunit TsaD [Bdellovibrionales bacterium]|nr:tRNA (adenosine(37)-N6)-threonylcarbamoyltransferase complex transferase subunit TsaD [Bdellovibrionales bacterium]